MVREHLNQLRKFFLGNDESLKASWLREKGKYICFH
jgi:hypothetical protein